MSYRNNNGGIRSPYFINPLQAVMTDYGHPWLKYFLKRISCQLWLYQPPQPVAYLWDVLGAGSYAIYNRLYLSTGREECSVGSVTVGTLERRVFVQIAKGTGRLLLWKGMTSVLTDRLEGCTPVHIFQMNSLRFCLMVNFFSWMFNDAVSFETV
jgi:hypothetical protein